MILSKFTEKVKQNETLIFAFAVRVHVCKGCFYYSTDALTKAFLHYKWSKTPTNADGKPVQVNKNIQLAEFKIVDVKTSEHDLDRFTG